MFNDLLEINGQFPSSQQVTSAKHIRIYFPMEKTMPLLLANSTLADYFRNLMRLDSAHGFVTHHSFTFVSTSMMRRHVALNTVNVFFKRCTQDLALVELKRALLGGREGPKQVILLRSSYSSNKTKSEVQDLSNSILYSMAEIVFGRQGNVFCSNYPH